MKITHSGKVFLGHSLVLAAFLDNLSHLQCHSLVVQLLRLRE